MHSILSYTLRIWYNTKVHKIDVLNNKSHMHVKGNK